MERKHDIKAEEVDLTSAVFKVSLASKVTDLHEAN